MVINFFPPAAGGGVYRPLSFVKYLSRKGWDVTVVTPEPGEFWISDTKLMDQIPKEVRVIRTASLSGQRLLGQFARGKSRRSRRSSSRFGVLRKIGEFFLLPDTYVGWVPFAARTVGRLCASERFDIVYSTSPPDSSHLAVRRIVRRYRIPWVADFRDPWISLYLRNPPTPVHAAIHKRMEKSVVAADRVIVTTFWQKEKLEQLFPTCRVEKIANGYDEEDFDRTGSITLRSDRFSILHSGMLTLGRTTRPFLEGLRLLLERRPELEDKINVLFLGPRETENELWVEKLGLSKVVSFRDNIPHSECIRLERGSHVLLLIKHDDERYRGLVPGKLFEYIGARRPVLAVAPAGEAASIVKDLNRGEVVSADNPGSVAEVIEKMFMLVLQGKLEDSYSLGEEPDYSRRVAAEKLDMLFQSLLEGK